MNRILHLILISGIGAAVGHASLIVRDSPVWGSSSIVWDTQTGLYWLSPVETLGLTYNTVTARLGAGDYVEFSYATDVQVHQLFVDAGITDFTNVPTSADAVASRLLVNSFGATAHYSGTVNGIPYVEDVLYGLARNLSFPTYASLDFTIAQTLQTTSWYNCTGPNPTNCGESTVGGYLSDRTSANAATGSWLVADHLSTPEPASAGLIVFGALALYCTRKRVRRAV